MRSARGLSDAFWEHDANHAASGAIPTTHEGEVAVSAYQQWPRDKRLPLKKAKILFQQVEKDEAMIMENPDSLSRLSDQEIKDYTRYYNTLWKEQRRQWGLDKKSLQRIRIGERPILETPSHWLETNTGFLNKILRFFKK
ncbi:MAG: hypothetical protein HEQ32_01750 [Vampirovibrio sp.]